MFDQGSSTGSPQFGTAEFKNSPAGDVCKVCGQALPGIYYRANRATVCAGCIERVRASLPKDSHSAFVRGLLFGFGGFIAGLILYAGFTILTGIEIGFVSLAVGWLVGKAMRLGSGGIGGRRYQVAAILLTYAAVSLAYVPIGIHYAITHRSAQTQTQKPATSPAADNSDDAQPTSGETSSQQPPRSRPNLGGLVVKLVLFGLASPFLQLQAGISGVIGLVILLVGMQFAWKFTAGAPRILIDGPFDNSKSLRT